MTPMGAIANNHALQLLLNVIFTKKDLEVLKEGLENDDKALVQGEIADGPNHNIWENATCGCFISYPRLKNGLPISVYNLQDYFIETGDKLRRVVSYGEYQEFIEWYDTALRPVMIKVLLPLVQEAIAKRVHE